MNFEFEFKEGPFYRTMGPTNSRELIGAGFMHKQSGKDQINYNPPAYSLCYVINGTGRYVDKIGEYKLKPGSYFQRIPGQEHSTYIDNEWLECFIDFGSGLCDILCKMGMIDPQIPCGMTAIDRSIPDTIADFRRTLESSQDQQLRMLIPQFIDMHQRIINSSNSKSSADDAIIARASQLLRNNLELRIDLHEFCKENDWGYEKFRKIFKTATGISPAHYRLRRRLDEAKRLLLTNRDMPLSQIARKLGYTNVYEFNAQFKKTTGLPPGKFRNQ